MHNLQAAFGGSSAYRLAQNAITRHSVDDVALNHRVVFAADHTFSTVLDDWAVTDQKQTGRCWMFAGLNLLRFSARQKLSVKEFEFSQNYLMFWDKLERANYFFEAIILVITVATFIGVNLARFVEQPAARLDVKLLVGPNDI